MDDFMKEKDEISMRRNPRKNRGLIRGDRVLGSVHFLSVVHDLGPLLPLAVCRLTIPGAGWFGHVGVAHAFFTTTIVTEGVPIFTLLVVVGLVIL